MQKHVHVIAAAVLAVGGLAMGQAQQQQEWKPGQQPQQQPGQVALPPAQTAQMGQMGDQAQPAGSAMGGAQDLQRQIPSQAATMKEDASSKREVQKVIAHVAEAAVTEGRFDQIRQSLAKSDQDRMQQGAQGQQPGAMGQPQPGVAQPPGQAQPGAMGQQTAQGGQDLDNAIKELRQAYKDKYNKDLKFSEEQILPQQVTVMSGEVTNPQMLTQWPLRASQSGGGRAGLDMQDDQAQPAAGGIGQPAPAGGMGQQAQPHSRGGGLKQGDKIAAVRLPKAEQAPELTVSLVQSEGGQWALDIPDTIDGTQLRQNLSQHIRHITQNKDSLPQDADKASQQIAHHVLMALYDVDMQQGAGMGGGM